jgi:putative nucleotidyltransferase with HDIG domain
MERLPRVFQAYILAVMTAASTFLWFSAATISWNRWPEMLMFTALITLAAMFPVPNPRGGYITPTPTLLYVLLCVHNPQTALLVSSAGSGLGAVISRGWIPWMRLFNGAQWGLSVGLAGVVFSLLGGSLENPGVLSLLVPLTLALFTLQVTNSFFVACFFSWARKTPFWGSWLPRFKDYLWANFLTAPTAALLAILFVSVHPLTLLLFLISLPAQRWAIQLYLQHQRIYGQAINSLVVAIDASFPEGRGHSRRVADLAVAMARQLGLADSVVDGIELGALVHDVGMIGLEELVESKDRSDATKLLEHVKIGAEVAREVPRRDVGQIVLYHHEHFDGTGYLGLKGSEIPIGARIVALAEAVESMISAGSSGLEHKIDETLVTRIRQGAGGLFDPRVVEAFLEVAKDDPSLLQRSSNSSTTSLAAVNESSSEWHD